MAQQETITLLGFQKRFGDDEACRAHLFKIRYPEGFICPHCGGKVCYKIAKRNVYECKECGHQVYLTAGTVMHRTHIGLLKWFWALYLISHDKRGVSAKRLERELEVSYPTAWTMLQKIRKAMGARDANYQLAGMVELDDAYFGGPTEGGKRGRGTEKTPVLVGVSVTDKGNPLYVKMSVIDDIKNRTLVTFAEEKIKPGATISSDAYSSYIKAFSSGAYQHQPVAFNPKEHPDHLQWLHTMISNAKAFIGGTYHGLGAKHLQRYLDEFCFRTNRRQFAPQLFNRLLSACAATTTITFRQLVDGGSVPALT
jgi:transposase-like protein